jgi:hypothetical protein
MEQRCIHASDGTGASAGATPVPALKANGFTALAHGAAVGPDGALHLVSLLGRRAVVEAIAASLLVGKAAVLSPDPARVGFDVHAPQCWACRQLARRLPDGTAQVVLLPAHADFLRAQETPFTLLAPATVSTAAIAHLHYLFLARCGETPLAREWAPWLWERACRTGEALALRCYGSLPAAWSCRPETAALRADLAQALKGATTYGRLPLPAGIVGQRAEVA